MSELKNNEFESKKALRRAKIYSITAKALLCFLYVFGLGIIFFDYKIGFPKFMFLQLGLVFMWFLLTSILLIHMSHSLKQHYILMQAINDIKARIQ